MYIQKWYVEVVIAMLSSTTFAQEVFRWLLKAGAVHVFMLHNKIVRIKSKEEE